MRFSDRYGYTTVRAVVQRESMDDALRNGLWSVLHTVCWNPPTAAYQRTNVEPATRALVHRIWDEVFKEPTDTIPDWLTDVFGTVREYFFRYQWYEVYNFVEFMVNRHPSAQVREDLAVACNHVMKREQAAYRIINGRVAEITAEEEIVAVEQALEVGEDVPGVRTHLSAALSKLSDREDPDYRNSIKESISAVESAVNHVTGGKATLGEALKRVDPPLHPALQEAFSKLYGYTSDAEGIRHALMAKSSLDFDDAKFMLVACSAFINYLVAKADGSRSLR